MQLLKANTAVDVLIGPFLDDSDGNAVEDGLTISQADVRLSKNGQNMAQKNDNTAASHDELGYYNCELDDTDTNTEGTLVLVVHESGALTVRHEFMVLAEAAYDSLFVAKDTGFMDVNVKAVSEDTAAADNLESACDNYSVTRGLTGTALPAAAADAAGGVPISDDGGVDLDELYDAIVTDAAGTNIAVDIIALKAETATIVADTNELQGDWTNAGRLDTILDSILADTGELQVDNIPGTLSTMDGKLDTIDNFLDTEIAAIVAAVITNAAGADVAADIIALKAETATIVTDTNELQADDVPTLIAALPTAAEVLDATEAITGDTLSLETMVTRIYMRLFHEVNVTDADGSAEIRNSADDGNVATGGITDAAGTTSSAKWSWT